MRWSTRVALLLLAIVALATRTQSFEFMAPSYPYDTEILENLCYYAKYGKWMDDRDPPPLPDQKRFYYVGSQRNTFIEIIKRCPKYIEATDDIHFPDLFSTVFPVTGTDFLNNSTYAPPLNAGRNVFPIPLATDLAQSTPEAEPYEHGHEKDDLEADGDGRQGHEGHGHEIYNHEKHGNIRYDILGYDLGRYIHRLIGRLGHGLKGHGHVYDHGGHAHKEYGHKRHDEEELDEEGPYEEEPNEEEPDYEEPDDKDPNEQNPDEEDPNEEDPDEDVERPDEGHKGNGHDKNYGKSRYDQKQYGERLHGHKSSGGI